MIVDVRKEKCPPEIGGIKMGGPPKLVRQDLNFLPLKHAGH